MKISRPPENPDTHKGERVQSTTLSGVSWARQREISISDALARVQGQLRKLGVGGDDIVVSTNVPLRLDGLPRSASRAPDDPGAAVYWQAAGSHRRCIAIDQYRSVAHNLAAIAATLDAMRSIERHGGAEILDRAFTGFAALPAPGAARAWHEVLGVPAHASTAEVKVAFRRAASDAHPDRGGSDARMAEVNRARAAFESERGL